MPRQPHTNPAETAASQALDAVLEHLTAGKSFRLEAGAGAGKTWTLVSSLAHLIAIGGSKYAQKNQQIACITFTRVAKQEIDSRINGHAAVYTDTIHGFCWSSLKIYQKHLLCCLGQMDYWRTELEQASVANNCKIEYSLGRRKIEREHISLGHDDVIRLMALSMDSPKFRKILSIRFPFILIDEYQDTNALFIDSVKRNFLDHASGPVFGFFGDHWQRIYGSNACGKIEHPNVSYIGKGANFRSVRVIVECLNRMRPQLTQEAAHGDEAGSVSVFHTNDWDGLRRDGGRGGHWKGDTPEEVSHAYLARVRSMLAQAGWQFEPPHTKILMLTHSVLAKEQGYPTLMDLFSSENEQLIQKQHPYISFLTDIIESACLAYEAKKYGDMFNALAMEVPPIKSHKDKIRWSNFMHNLLKYRSEGSVGDVIEYIKRMSLIQLPSAVEDKEKLLASSMSSNIADERIVEDLERIRKMKTIQYQEIIALDRFIDEATPFATKHGVKGAEFDNVLVVIGRGWNQYDFDQMLALTAKGVPDDKQNMYERNRNLFYVACSRPKKRLALLFTQRLSPEAMETLSSWFGRDAIHALPASP